MIAVEMTAPLKIPPFPLLPFFNNLILVVSVFAEFCTAQPYSAMLVLRCAGF